MNPLGQRISLWLVVLVAVTALGATGTTAVYQDSAREIQAENDELRAQNAQLREQLNETRREREKERSRAAEFEARLQTRNRDVEQVTTELSQTERRLNTTRSELADSAETDLKTTQLRERLKYLCSQPENRDNSACNGIPQD